MNPRAFKLTKQERLRSETLIAGLFEKGSAFYFFPFKVIVVKNKDHDAAHHQVLFSVSKKVYRKAADRNLIKRRMRESYRLNKNLLPDSPKRLIAYIYNAKEILTFAQIQERLIKT